MVQSIQRNSNSFSPFQGLITFSSCRFAVFSRYLQFYNAQLEQHVEPNEDKELKKLLSPMKNEADRAILDQKNATVFPAVSCHYHPEMRQIFVLLKTCLRVYDAHTGRLQNLLAFELQEGTCLTVQARKVYIGFSNSTVQIFNAKTMFILHDLPCRPPSFRSDADANYGSVVDIALRSSLIICSL